MRKSPSATLPAEVHTPPSPSTRVKRPRIYLRIDRLFPPVLSHGSRRLLTAGLWAVAVAVGILLWRWSGWDRSPAAGFEGGFHGGLPVMPPPIETERDTPPAAESASDEAPTEAAPPDVPRGTEPTPESDTSAPLPPEPPDESAGDSSLSTPPESDSAGTASPPGPETQVPPITTEPTTEPITEPATEPAAKPETQPATEPETEPTPEPPPIPDGCFPITSQDLSEPHRGAGYIHNEGVTLPAALPDGSPWRVKTPAVLIVNTHPYEGYHDGAPWYDPTQGGLAQTDSPNAPDGVVALSVALTRALRDRGVTVIHLRVPTTPEESSADLYDRTEAMIRYYCRLYPDIGLILDLRRSAELTETGEILRTEGIVNGTSTAQLRITVSGGREPQAMSRDLAVALALREGLWAESPSLSRPVCVKNRDGLLSDASDLRVLTLEMGAAGNTYAEAMSLVPPLARALDEILQNYD